MPELPEVTTVAKILNREIKNLTITDSMIFYTKLLKNVDITTFKAAVKNQKIVEVTNYAKYIAIKLEDWVLISHLRMEGKWMIEEANSYSYDQKHLEAQLALSNGKFARYYDTRKFGTLELYSVDTYKNSPSLVKLGPIPGQLGATSEYLYSKTKRSRKAIKTLLLDQTVVAGLGNIYVNEVLFATKMSPEEPANNLTLQDCKNLMKASKEILSKAIELGGTTIHTFKSSVEVEGNYQEHLKVHLRAGHPCFNCGFKIAKNFVNGRGTYYCPKCQILKK
ncbi:DNA-formamidopyrimidine glycosylase [Mesoplasma syrphidae]|uniref:DNA-formamidopyrimidine glycosylase n=1 Tax=Mesoplasma syrphidae TaxID=225999 RepID=A0A2K9BJ47_9MOLU|nr:DNA-formamidopyrimidine glycosylase [Mesoplasma syrphidae]AUF83371.1 DNA-formamidopyrimidine glycosylase [Mesoplasma syrphidae]